MRPPYCIVSSFRIPAVRIWLDHTDVLLVLGDGIMNKTIKQRQSKAMDYLLVDT